MEDFLAALLGGAIELFAEVIFQVFLEFLVALVERSSRKASSEYRLVHPMLSGLGYLILGAVVGAASVVLVPHRLVPPSKFHGISLVISPLVTGLIMSQLGSMIRRVGKTSVRIESFAYGFAFALGLAIVRFAFFR